MPTTKTPDDLVRLHQHMRSELHDLTISGGGMRAPLTTRYGAVEVCFDYDGTARSLRVYIPLTTPVGTGVEFLRWCMTMNTLYWDVKTALDSEGRLLVLSDVDVEHGNLAASARVALGRLSAICELIDDDLVNYLMAHNLATPAQLERWIASRPA